MGIITAHYSVEGGGFYGIPLDRYLPYAVSRTWHLQLGIFWIATAWLAAGLYIGPSVGTEPRFQRLGVNVLFGALLVVVVGSMTGQWLSVENKLSDAAWFYIGHSGYEYIDLGRLWQTAFRAAPAWLVLVRAISPALRRNDEQKPILTLFFWCSSGNADSTAPRSGYWGRTPPISPSPNDWRCWWVVHPWVRRVSRFATVVIAFCSRLRLVSLKMRRARPPCWPPRSFSPVASPARFTTPLLGTLPSCLRWVRRSARSRSYRCSSSGSRGVAIILGSQSTPLGQQKVPLADSIFAAVAF